MGKSHVMGGGFGIKWKVCQYNGDWRIYSLIDNEKKIIGCKWATLTKHQGCQIAMSNMCQLKMRKCGTHIVEDYAHFKNMKLHV